MQGGRGGRGNPFFGMGDPFGGLGGGFGEPFGGFGGIGDGFANHRSMMSSFFGGRSPFDDPFFTRPFGGGMFESHFFGSNGSPFADMQPSGFIENQPPEPKKLKGPIIEELNSDDEKEEADENKNKNPRKHGRSSKEPYVVDPDDDDDTEERKSKQLQHSGSHSRFGGMEQQPQTRSFCYQSSTVSYGGANGTYYTSSKTRRTGSDGLTFEENKEADSSTQQASHRISRGLHNKGHTLARKLQPDGKVETMQTLHNLNQDELTGFEEAWKGNATKSLPGWSGNSSSRDIGVSSSRQNREAGRGGWALPPTEQVQHMENPVQDARGRAGMPHSGRMKGPSDFKDNSGHSRGRARE